MAKFRRSARKESKAKASTQPKLTPATSKREMHAHIVKCRVKARELARETFALVKGDLESSDAWLAYMEAFSFLASIVPCNLQEVLHEEPKRKPTPIGRLGTVKLPFGQYTGKSFDDTPLEYLDWLCRSQEEFHRPLREYLKHPDLKSRRRGLKDG